MQTHSYILILYCDSQMGKTWWNMTLNSFAYNFYLMFVLFADNIHIHVLWAANNHSEVQNTARFVVCQWIEHSWNSHLMTVNLMWFKNPLEFVQYLVRKHCLTIRALSLQWEAESFHTHTASSETLLPQCSSQARVRLWDGEMDLEVQIFMQIDHWGTAMIKSRRTGLRWAESSS